MSQFQPMKASTLIMLQEYLKLFLDEVYGVIVNGILKLHSNSCCRNIHLCENVWVMILIQFDVLSKRFPSYERVSYMENVIFN